MITLPHTFYHFKKGQVNRTLFVKRDEKSLLVAQVYVDDIFFGSIIDHLA